MTEQYPFSDFRDKGLLWLINRVVLHPRGFAMALHYDNGDPENSEPTGWSIMGDGSEIWAFDYESDDEKFRLVEDFLAAVKEINASEPEQDLIEFLGRDEDDV